MTCEEAGCPTCYPPAHRPLTRAELRVWLDRKPPHKREPEPPELDLQRGAPFDEQLPSPRWAPPDLRDWYEFAVRESGP